MSGSFTISLDFELRWGIRDNAGSDRYLDAIMGGREAIPEMLKLFAHFDIAATWATVGFLFAKDKDELIDHLPKDRPSYRDASMSPYGDIDTRVGQDEADDPLHFGLSLIERIQDTPRQEIGSHTFSHFYCLEEGGGVEAFAADMEAARSIAAARDVTAQSLVLPRNQVSVAHLDAAKRAGITVFRGNPSAPFYAARPRGREKLALRALRLADSMLPLAATAARPGMDTQTQMFDTPASRFLRPIASTTSLRARAQRRRIKAEMTSAAKRGLNYHLWWHPHNMGRATEANIAHLQDLLKHYQILHNRHGMQSRSMIELAQAGS